MPDNYPKLSSSRHLSSGWWLLLLVVALNQQASQGISLQIAHNYSRRAFSRSREKTEKERKRKRKDSAVFCLRTRQTIKQPVSQTKDTSVGTHTHRNWEHSTLFKHLLSLLFTHSIYLSWEVNGRPGAERWWRGGGRGWNCCRCRCEASRSVRTIRSGACPDCRQLSPNCHWHRHNRARPRHQTWRASPTSAGHCRSPDCSCAGRTVASTVSSKEKERKGKESEEND